MAMPRRKQNRLPDYDYGRPGYYFITICTRGKRHTLGTVVGADVLIGPYVVLSDLGIAVQKTIDTMPAVDKYVIMPNHVHLIFHLLPSEKGPMGTSAPTASIPMLVRYLKRSVTVAWDEPVWQDDYYDHIIRNDRDYRRIWQYIETNPAKWREDRYYCDMERENDCAQPAEMP